MALKCAVRLKSFDPERTFNHQHFLIVWAFAAVSSLISVNKISDAVRISCLKNWRNLTSENSRS